MKLRRAFADANKIVRRSMDFRYIGELTESVSKKSCFGLDYSDLPECCCKLFMVTVLFGQC